MTQNQQFIVAVSILATLGGAHLAHKTQGLWRVILSVCAFCSIIAAVLALSALLGPSLILLACTMFTEIVATYSIEQANLRKTEDSPLIK